LTAVPGAAGTGADDAQFDRLIYERVRLGIMSALAVREELTFTELKALFDVSDGLSPFFLVVTLSPTSTISPAGSCPNIHGKLRVNGDSPCMMWTSL
jgi:hypothetical protein